MLQLGTQSSHTNLHIKQRAQAFNFAPHPREHTDHHPPPPRCTSAITASTAV